jgi:hypothetical protein
MDFAWRNVERYAGVLCLVISAMAALAVQSAISSLSTFTAPTSHFGCMSDKGMEASMSLYSINLTWLSLVTLEAVVAGFACLYSAFCIYAAARAGSAEWRVPFTILFVVGAISLAWDFCQIHKMGHPSDHPGLISHLLATLWACPQSVFDSVVKSVVRARMLGESPGIFIGIAMAATMTMPRTPSPLELGQRIRRLNHLLYAASVLFVAGIMVTRANLNLILSYWNIPMEEAMIGNLTTAGILASGIAYSCILLIFYIPARCLAEFHARKAIPETEAGTLEAREKWLKENGLAQGFRAELQQVLAILAPVISAPIFEALAKS